MKRLITLGAAFLPLALVAGFSQYLDVSALDDIPDECKQLSGSIAEYGVTEGSIWTPADVQANAETGILELNSESTMTYFPVSLDDYVRFGAYDDTASIEAFMQRGSFYKTDKYGEQYLAYTSDDISRIYTQMEDANYDTFEAICIEVEENVEKMLEDAKQRNDVNAIERATKAAKALQRFFASGKNAAAKTAANALNCFAKKARDAQNEYQKARYKHELLAAQNSSANINDLYKQLDSLSVEMEIFTKRYMNDMNTIGAYLGSTNAMEYFSADFSEGYSDEDLNRWFKFSDPGTFGKDEDRAIRYLGTGTSKTFNTIIGNLSPSRFMMWYDEETLYDFMSMYGEGEFNENKIRGFKREVSLEGENEVTNWVANLIYAPKNWADGTSIVVTNGKFRANAAATRLVGTASGNEIVIGGPSAVTNTVTFAAAQDSNVSVSVGKTSEHNFTVTIGVYYK